MRKNDAFVAKIVNTGLTKIFMVIFAPDKRLPSFATLLDTRWKPPPHYLWDEVHQCQVKDTSEFLQNKLI